MPTSDNHTADLLDDGVDFDTVLAFHLTSRIFPPRSDAGTRAFCAEAIEKWKAGDRTAEVNLRDVATFRNRDTAPAENIIANFNLWAFLDGYL